MEKELTKIHDFVQSLERTQLNGEQQSVLLIGEDTELYGGGNNEECNGNHNSGDCSNTIECKRSTNDGNCSNRSCSGSTNGCSGGTGGTGGTNGSGASMMGFPGFGL